MTAEPKRNDHEKALAKQIAKTKKNKQQRSYRRTNRKYSRNGIPENNDVQVA